MCTPESASLEILVREAVAGTGAPVAGLSAPPPPEAALPIGSRRQRLWELGSHAHCPVIGVCLPITALRRVVNKVLGGQAVADDYELHCAAIAECKRRTSIAQAMQKELDRRYLPALRLAARVKSAEALAEWWREASAGNGVAGALWAVLTHGRCTPALEQQVLAEVHMLQHQVGVATRVDLARVEALADENALLTRELAVLRQRAHRDADEHARQAEQWQADVRRLRGELIGRDTALAQARDELRALEVAAPGLRSRVELAQETQRQSERLEEVRRELQQANQETERQRRRADEAAAERVLRDRLHDALRNGHDDMVDAFPRDGDPTATHATRAEFENRAVLCVGGRTASVPVYRRLVERTGGRFLHHDGGEEDGSARLAATLAAADLVICQTGCISHDAYWRVKDNCKRTGKRCVFVDTPSRAGLERALGRIQQEIHQEPAREPS